MGNDDVLRDKWFREIEDIETSPAVFNLRSKDEGSIRLGTKKYKGFNIGSPKQLLEKFTALLGEQPVDGKTGKPSASRAALQAYAADHHVVQTYLAWKKAEKRRQMVDSIFEKLDSDGFVRASYLQLGAESGRMSCIKPNNQQIPRDEDFRRCVEAPDGWLLVDADFGQMELRLAAAVAKDSRMIKAFQDGEDLHTVTAEAIGCTRQIAKSANFGLLYGSGAKGLRNYAAGVGITMPVEEAAEIRKQWLGTYQGIAAWQQQNAEDAEKSEGNKWAQIRIPKSNMRRFLPGDMNRLTVRCNTPIQGAGAAILKCALGNLWPELEKVGEVEARIAACIHDEILLLVKEDKAEEWAAKLKRIMEDAEAMWLGDIPPLAEPSIGKRWSEIH
jgi:DNA polymerase-1